MKLPITNLLWILGTLALAVIMVLVTLDYYDEFKEKRQLEENGIIVESTIVEKYIDTDYRNTKYYHVKATLIKNEQPMTISKLVNRKFYKRIAIDDTAQLHYLESNPETIDFVKNKDKVNTFYWMLVPLFLSVIIAVGVLYLNLVKPILS